MRGGKRLDLVHCTEPSVQPVALALKAARGPVSEYPHRPSHVQAHHARLLPALTRFVYMCVWLASYRCKLTSCAIRCNIIHVDIVILIHSILPPLMMYLHMHTWMQLQVHPHRLLLLQQKARQHLKVTVGNVVYCKDGRMDVFAFTVSRTKW